MNLEVTRDQQSARGDCHQDVRVQYTPNHQKLVGKE